MPSRLNNQLTNAASPAIAKADATNREIANNMFLQVFNICGNISIVPMYLRRLRMHIYSVYLT